MLASPSSSVATRFDTRLPPSTTGNELRTRSTSGSGTEPSESIPFAGRIVDAPGAVCRHDKWASGGSPARTAWSEPGRYVVRILRSPWKHLGVRGRANIPLRTDLLEAAMVRDGEVVELCTGEFAGAQAEPAHCAANDISRLPTGITAGNATPEATLPGFPCCRDGHGRPGRAELVSLGFFGVVGEVGDDAYEVVGGGGFGGGDGAFDCVPVGVAGGAVSGCPGGG